METVISRLSYLKIQPAKMLIIILIGICLWLTISSFRAANSAANDTASFTLAPFMSLAPTDTRGARIATLNNQLEFMVWPIEREKLLRALLEEVHAQINLNPYAYLPWRNLTFAVADSNVGASEQAWILERALRLGGWHDKERVLLARLCVRGYKRLLEGAPTLCHDLLTSLAVDGVTKKLTRSLGISEEQLKRVLKDSQLDLQLNRQ